MPSRHFIAPATWFALAALLAAGAQAALPGDSAAGARLHQAHCTSCHGAEVYTRKERSVGSLAALREQLDGCTHMAKAEFSPSQRQDLIKYLNDQYYRFP